MKRFYYRNLGPSIRSEIQVVYNVPEHERKVYIYEALRTVNCPMLLLRHFRVSLALPRAIQAARPAIAWILAAGIDRHERDGTTWADQDSRTS